MGDAYRGLTIRIGADAQPLNRALSHINSAAKTTSREVSRITKALKLDPSNTELIGLKIRALGDQSKAAATQIVRMREALDQTLSKYKGGKSNLSTMLKEAEANAARFRTEFNTLDQTLQSGYDRLISFKQASEGLSKGEAVKAVKRLREEARSSAEAMKQLETQLRAAWAAMKGNGGTLPFGAKNVDEAIAKWRALVAAQKEAQRQLTFANEFVGVKNLVVDLELAESELKQVRIEAINARNALQQMGSSKGARNAASQQRLLAESTKEAESALHSYVGISKSLPNSFEAAAMQARSFEQVTRLINQQIQLASARLKTLDSSEVEKIERDFVTTGNAVRVLTDRAGGLEREMEKISAEISQVKERMIGLEAGSKEFQKCESEVRELNARLETTENKLIGVSSRLRTANEAHAFRTTQGEIAGLNGQLATHEAMVARVGKKWGQFGANVRTAGYSMMATVGATAMIGGMYAIQAAKDIDSAYRNMRKTVNGTEEQFVQLKKAALEFSQTHFTSADQILEIEAIGGQLGIQAQNLQKFSEVVSSIDIATNLDTETISQNLGQLSNIMNDMDQNLQSGPGSMEAYGDALVRLGNNTAAQEDKIQNVMMRIASMGTICGMSTPDLLALASATAATGQGAEAAGTALSKTFSGIESAVNGSERALAKLRESGDLTEEEIEELNGVIEAGEGKLEAFAEVAGMSADDFKRAWNETPMDAFKAFIGGLQRIDAEGGSVDSTLTGLKITSVRQKQTLQGLTQTFDILGNAITMSNDAWNGVSDQWGAAGDAAREAQRKSEGFSGQLEMLKNNAKVLADVFLESLTPALAGAVNILRGFVDAFKELPDGVKQMVVGATALAALSGPMMIFSGTVLSAGSGFKDFFTGQRKGWEITKSALDAGGDALLVASTKLNKNGQAIGKSGKLLDRFGDKMVSAGAKVETFASKSGRAGGTLSKLGTGIGNLGIAASSAAAYLAPFLAILGTLGVVVGGSAAYVDSLTAKTKAAKEANDKLGDSSKKLRDSMKEAFSGIGDKVSSSLTASFEDAMESYQSFADKIASSKTELADDAATLGDKLRTIKSNSEEVISLMKMLERNGSLTELEYEKLSLALDAYNQATNDSVQVTKDEDGAIRVLRDGVELTADAFNDLARAQENAAKADYFKKQYNVNFENKIEASKQVQSLQKQYDDAVEAKRKFESDMKPASNATWEEWQQYNVQLAQLEDRVDAAGEALKGASDEYVSAAKSARYAAEMSALLNSELSEQEGTFENLIKNNEDVIAAFAATENSVGDFKAILEKAGVSVESLKGKDIAAMVRDWDGSMPDLINSFKTLGLITDETAESLKGFNLVRIDDKTYIVDDQGSIQWQEDQVHDLQEFTFDDKHYYVTDDGTLYDQQGLVSEFNKMTVNDKPYWVTDNGSILGQEGQLAELENFQLNGKTLYVTSDGLMTAEGELYAFDQLGLDPKDFEVNDDGTIKLTEEQLEHLNRKIEGMPPSFTVTAIVDTDSAYSKLNSLENQVNRLNGSQINMTVALSGQNAAGGLKRMATQKNVALHAAGAFITNGTTYIGSDKAGVHHIAGEAGREFVQHHADGTTQIIPIQNRKYMLPFASVVADMLSSPEFGGISREDLYRAADAVVRSNQQQGDIVLVLDDREVARAVRRYAS